MAAARNRTAHWIAIPVRTQDFVESLLARRYRTKERKVVRIITFTAVFFADMTPRNPRTGWCVPPMALASWRVTTMLRGVAQTMNPNARMPIMIGTYFRYR